MKTVTHTITTYDMEDYNKIKETMTNEEAALFLEIVKRGYISDYGFSGTEEDYESYCYHVAIRKAIDLLKQER